MISGEVREECGHLWLWRLLWAGQGRQGPHDPKLIPRASLSRPCLGGVQNLPDFVLSSSRGAFPQVSGDFPKTFDANPLLALPGTGSFKAGPESCKDQVCGKAARTPGEPRWLQRIPSCRKKSFQEVPSSRRVTGPCGRSLVHSPVCPLHGGGRRPPGPLPSHLSKPRVRRPQGAKSSGVCK